MDVAELAQAGAAALVTTMTTETWQTISARLAALFGRPSEQETVLLEGCRDALVHASDATTTGDVAAILRSLLLDRLTQDAEFTERVRAFVAEPSDRPTVQQTATVGRGGHSYQAGRDLTIGTPPA